MNKLTLQGYMLVPNDQLETVLSALPKHIELTLNEPGCLVFRVSQDTANPCRLDVYEEFTDQAAFQRHQQRTQDSDWGKVTAGAQRYYSVSMV